jgi:hypothetical protein
MQVYTANARSKRSTMLHGAFARLYWYLIISCNLSFLQTRPSHSIIPFESRYRYNMTLSAFSSLDLLQFLSIQKLAPIK